VEYFEKEMFDPKNNSLPAEQLDLIKKSPAIIYRQWLLASTNCI